MVSRDELLQMNITKLKAIAKELKIPSYSSMRAEDKEKLINLILEKQLSGPPPPGPPPPGPPPPLLPARDGPGPSTKIEEPSKFTRKEYSFIPTEVLSDVNVKLSTYQPDKSRDTDEEYDAITPEILIKQVKSDDFIMKIITTLYNLYRMKDKKYQVLEQKIDRSIKLDLEEMKEMEKVVTDSREVAKMFPLMSVNKALLVKIKKLRVLCQQVIKEYSSINPNIVKKVRQNFMDAITNDDIGILSVTGENRKNIRNQLCKTLFILSKGYRPFMDSFINIVFTGPAGVGKTKLAGTVGYIYSKSGILLVGELIIVSPKDLIADYIGQTGSKTAGILMKGLESIIFIDEAYQIMPCDDGKLAKDTRSYGPEAITEIVNFLDKYMGLSIMIVAGYEREIQGCFFEANEGLPRRFPIRYNLPPYSIEALLNIFLNEINKRVGKDLFGTTTAEYIYTLMYKLNNIEKDIFKNQAGDMINLVSMFLNVYYGSYKVNWGTLENNKIMINNTFNVFLKNKGYQMKISS
jgi:hypothetical protein